MTPTQQQLISPIRIIREARYNSFLERVLSKATSNTYRLPYGTPVDQGAYAREVLASRLSLLSEPWFICLLEAIGDEVERLVDAQQLMFDGRADDLTGVDFAILERVYIAVGAEIDRRRAP